MEQKVQIGKIYRGNGLHCAVIKNTTTERYRLVIWKGMIDIYIYPQVGSNEGQTLDHIIKYMIDSGVKFESLD